MTTTTTTLAEDAAALRVLKQRATAIDAQAKELKADAKSAEIAFLNRLEDEGVESIKYDGTLFVPAETTYGNVSDRSVFIEWALENSPELVEYKERPKLVNETVREYLDNGQELPPGLDFYVKQYVSQRAG